MAAIDNLVDETSTSEGAGDFTLSNKSGRNNFNTAFGIGGTDVFFYFILHRTAAQYEFGTGHLSAANTLVRDTVLGNSSGNTSLIDFTAGTKDVMNSVPANLRINELGESGQFLASNGVELVWAGLWWETLASAELVNTSNVGITGLSATYRAYKLVFDNYVPSIDNTDIWIRTSTNNGASYQAGASNYAWVAFGSAGGGTGADADGADSAIEVRAVAGSGFGNAGDEAASGEITLFNPANSGFRTHIQWMVGANGGNADDNGMILMGRGERRANQANNAFQILPSAGLINSINVTLYGLR